jgi:hypothetical protein
MTEVKRCTGNSIKKIQFTICAYRFRYLYSSIVSRSRVFIPRANFFPVAGAGDNTPDDNHK